MIKEISFAAFCSVLFLCGNLCANESLTLSVRAQIFPSTTIPLAEPSQIVLSIHSSQKLSFSTFSLPVSEDFHIQKVETSYLPKSSENKWESKITLAFTPLNVGEIAFPALTIPYSTAENRNAVLQTPPVTMSVRGANGESLFPEMLKDIKPPVSVGFSILVLTAILMVFLMVLTLWLMKKRKRPATETALPSMPKRPADVIALEELELLLIQYRKTGDTKIFYSGLSNIIRKFLSERYQMDALEKTTSEIFAEMRNREVERKICLSAKEILSDCDLVKFAKFMPMEKQLEEDFQKAKLYIEAAKIKEVILQPAEGSKESGAPSAKMQGAR